MNWQTVALKDTPATPWKNGGGSTHELLRWPSPSRWTWRMSVAEISSNQAFSEFKGLDRRLAVLRGEGLVLTIEGQAHALTATDAPLLFDGGADIRCSVDESPIQVFNLMLPRGLEPVEMARGSRMWS